MGHRADREEPALPRPPQTLTEGPILRTLVRLAGPIVAANVLQTVYQLVDTFWVGRLGAAAVAAVSLSFPVIFLLISLGGGIGIAGTILVAQSAGRGDRPEVDRVAAQTMSLVVLIALALSALGYAAAGGVMRAMGAGPETLPLAVSYLRISFLGLVFVFAYFVFQSLMRGVGDVRTPMFIVAGTVLLNFLLDPLFILGWGPVPAMGVAGAALATVFTQGLATAVGVAMLASGRYGVSLRGQRLVPEPALVRRLVRLGLPASVEQSTRALGMAMMAFLVAGFGRDVVAAYGIGTRILGFVIIPGLGLSMAASTMVGQNVGAGRLDRALRVARVGTALGFVALSAAGVAIFALARPLTAAFIPGAPAVVEMGADFLRIMALTFGFIGVQLVLNGVFRGAGNTVVAMVLAIVSLWVLRFPLAYALAERSPLGPRGIWWAFALSNVAAGVIAVGWFLRGSWKRRVPGEEEHLQELVVAEAMVEEGVE